jgi:TDG/mug DNA glycosylase family protein
MREGSPITSLPSEQGALPALGIGITNLVERVTVAASELDKEELRAGADTLGGQGQSSEPRCVAVLGLQAYRTAFRAPTRRSASRRSVSAPAKLWLLPNPSGLQARYQLPEMAELFRSLHAHRPGGLHRETRAPARRPDGTGPGPL